MPNYPTTFARLNIMRSFVLFAIACCTVATTLTAEEAIQFNRDIRPLLATCLRCHGPDEAARESGLRLDTRVGALAEADSGSAAIIPGKPSESVLLARVTTHDEDLRMPPADAGKPLTKESQDLLRRWIEQGASYETHWAWQAPKKPLLPPADNSNWTRGAIDRFVLARLKQEGLTPAKQADRYTLIRRLSLDLTGLQPTTQEVGAFVSDTRPDAYERLVDRLLASPAYGERWARPWLDLARYADSAGYAQDPSRTIWRYRDWVIGAFNENKPFNEFTIEQLAGDMLPNPTEDQLIATAFHRNTMTNSEGGTNDEEFRSAAVIDRVNTTMQVWSGLTMGCAQCHDHKYDPISQRDYFSMFAVFNNSEDSDKGDERPTLASYTYEQMERRRHLEREVAALEKTIAEELKNKEAPQATAEIPDGPLAPRFIRVELPGSKVFLSLAEVQAFSGDMNVATKGSASQKSTDFGGPAARAIDGNTNGDYHGANSTTHTSADINPWWEVDLKAAKPLQKIAIWNRTDGNVGSRLNNFLVVLLNEKREPIWATKIAKSPSPSVEIELPASKSARKPADDATLANYSKTNLPQSPKSKQLAAMKKELAGIKGVPTPIMRELPADRMRKTHIQIRGNYKVTGDEVGPAVPAFLPGLPQGEAANRLSVARWMVNDTNPLTSRVAVNRIWEHLFGRGLVVTSEDFGVQGELPTHPELLDWLAVEFRTQGWDQKRLLRMIVTSATYRQDTAAPTELTQRDPDNALLARGPRFRMSGEMIRDTALQTAGLLSHKMYGESVRPPRPVMGLKAAFGGSTDWQTSTGEDKYRRGLYTRWRRTTPYPSFMTFDAPSREFCTIRRLRTNTPLQALVTLNDPVFVEAAQGFARLINKQGGESLAEKSRFAFRRVVARPPTDREVARIGELWTEIHEEYLADETAAKQMAEDPIGMAPAGSSVTELAAWTVVANVLLNLDETIAPR